MKTLYPLEGDAVEAVGFLLYDKVGRSVWGSVRVRREKNPDVLVIEATQGSVNRASVWKPILHLVPVGGQLLQRNFGLRGGAAEDQGQGDNSATTEDVSQQGREGGVRKRSSLQYAEVGEDERDPHPGGAGVPSRDPVDGSGGQSGPADDQ